MIPRLALIAAFLIAPVTAWAHPMADHVPADAMIYVGWQGADDFGPGFDQSHLKAIVDASQFREFVDDFLPGVIDKLDESNPQVRGLAPIVGAIAKPTWRRPSAFFFSGIDMPAGQPPTPHLGFIWEAGGDADDLAAKLVQLTSMAPAPFPIKTLHQGPLVALLVGYADANSALPADATKSLANDADFKAAMAHLTVSNSLGAVYVNVPAIIKMADTLVPQVAGPDQAAQWAKLRHSLGLGAIGKIVAVSGFDGKDFASQLFAENVKMPGGPLDPKLLAAIPADVTMAGASRMDLGDLYDKIHKLAAEFQPGAVREFDRSLANVVQESGVDLRRDLLGALGDQWTYFNDPAIGGRGGAGAVLINRLADADNFERSMTKIEDYALLQIEKAFGADANIHLRFDTTRVDGMTIHYLAIPLAAPCWLIRDGSLYVAMFPQSAAAAARYAAAGKPSIEQNPQFVALLKRLGQENPSSFSYVDLPRTVPDAYGSWLMISRLPGFGDLFGIHSPPMLLPQLDQIMAQMEPSASASWSDASGMHVRAIEPFPGSNLLGADPLAMSSATAPLMVSIMLPALNRAREQGNRVKSASNLRQIGLAVAMYANGHTGQFPPDFGTLIKEEDLVPQVFINPRGNNSETAPHDQKQWPQWVNQHSDYVWIGAGRTTAMSPDIAIAYAKLDENTEGVNVLYGDFHVEWLPMAAARAEIEKARH